MGIEMVQLQEEILSAADLVAPFGAPNVRAVKRWAGQAGKLPPCKRVGNELVWLKSEVLAWLSCSNSSTTITPQQQVSAPVTGRRGRGRPRKIQVGGAV